MQCFNQQLRNVIYGDGSGIVPGDVSFLSLEENLIPRKLPQCVFSVVEESAAKNLIEPSVIILARARHHLMQPHMMRKLQCINFQVLEENLTEAI